MNLTFGVFLVFLTLTAWVSIWLVLQIARDIRGPINDVEASVKGHKLVGRGIFECQTNMLSKNFVNIHFEGGGFCIARGIDAVPFKRGTMIRVYKNSRTGVCKVVEDSKFLDVP